MRLILIGYWRGDDAPDWPLAQEWVDPKWDPKERLVSIDWLRSGAPIIHWRGLSKCRFCGRRNGASELSDGVYIWPEGLRHYLEEHRLRLPQAIVRRALERPVIPLEALNQVDVAVSDIEREWWRSLEPDWNLQK